MRVGDLTIVGTPDGKPEAYARSFRASARDTPVEAAETFSMDEDAFRAFYDRTARAVWAYLSRVTGNNALADDLVQETYYRFLCARVAFDDEAHRRNYLFRIATNLAHDRQRRKAVEAHALRVEGVRREPTDDAAASGEQQAEVRHVLARLKPREREMLWLAYAEGSSHAEIAAALGVRVGSVKVLLHRARDRFRQVLGAVRGSAARGLGR